MLNLKRLLSKRIEPTYQIKRSRCFSHRFRAQFCDFSIKRNTSKICTIYGKNFNYTSNVFNICCQERTSKLMDLFKCDDTKIVPGVASEDFIKIDGLNICRIGQSYVSMELLLFLNQITINSETKMIGVHQIVFIFQLNLSQYTIKFCLILCKR